MGPHQCPTKTPISHAAGVTAPSVFAAGAALPLVVALLVPPATVLWSVAGSALLFLALLGALAGWAGGAPLTRATCRVGFWGALAMAFTTLAGALFGVTA